MQQINYNKLKFISLRDIRLRLW